MKITRSAAVAAGAVALVASLMGCSQASTVSDGTSTSDGGTVSNGTSNSGGDSTLAALPGTVWSGVDSDDDFWQFYLDADNTVGVYLNDQFQDEASDTWNLANGTLTITLFFSDATVMFVGPWAPGANVIPLTGSVEGGASWTVDVSEEPSLRTG